MKRKYYYQSGNIHTVLFNLGQYGTSSDLLSFSVLNGVTLEEGGVEEPEVTGKSEYRATFLEDDWNPEYDPTDVVTSDMTFNAQYTFDSKITFTSATGFTPPADITKAFGSNYTLDLSSALTSGYTISSLSIQFKGLDSPAGSSSSLSITNLSTLLPKYKTVGNTQIAFKNNVLYFKNISCYDIIITPVIVTPSYTITITNNTGIASSAGLSSAHYLDVIDIKTLITSITLESGYVLDYIIIDGTTVENTKYKTGGYSFTMPNHNVSILIYGRTSYDGPIYTTSIYTSTIQWQNMTKVSLVGTVSTYDTALVSWNAYNYDFEIRVKSGETLDLILVKNASGQFVDVSSNFKTKYFHDIGIDNGYHKYRMGDLTALSADNRKGTYRFTVTTGVI